MKLKAWMTMGMPLLALAGLLDTAYLSAKFFLHQEVACSVISGCNEVLGSKYSHIGPVPLALMGAAYYTVLLVLSGIYLQNQNWTALKMVFGITSFGLVVSGVLVYLQVAVIGAICIFCITSAIITLGLFVFALKLRQTHEL